MPAAPLYLDVRTPAEHLEERLESSTNVPVDSLEKRLNELGPKDVPIVVFCRSGRRSAVAAQILQDAGFSRVIDIGSFEDALAASKMK